MAFVLENLLRFELELYLEFSLNIQLQQMNLGWKDFQALQNTQGGGGEDITTWPCHDSLVPRR